MARGSRNMVDRGLNHLQTSLNGSVKEGDRIPESTSVFKALKNWPTPIKGGSIVQQCLGKRFLCKPCTKSFCFLNVCNCCFMGFG
jgi:hypothetical protein